MKTVCLHGFTGSPESFEGIAPEGALVPALLGHAAAKDAAAKDAAAKDAAAKDAADFEAEVDRLAERGPAHFVGYSMGGRLALSIAARHPGRVMRLTLIGAHPGLRAAEDREARRRDDRALADRIEREGVERFAMDWAALPLFRAELLDEDTRARLRRIRTSHSAEGLARALRRLGLGSMPPVWDALSGLRIPIDLVVGEHDAKFRALAEETAAACGAETRVHVVANAGHDVPSAAPEFLRRLVSNGAGE